MVIGLAQVGNRGHHQTNASRTPGKSFAVRSSPLLSVEINLSSLFERQKAYIIQGLGRKHDQVSGRFLGHFSQYWVASIRCHDCGT